MTAYYNEHNPFAAAWLRELIKDGLIASGVVDERSIEDVPPNDLAGFTQHHFFAGIGGWSYALRLAGWSDDKAVWTGSCPCQPYSAAGKRGGAEDPRNLWPAFGYLIGQREPAIVFGEQVASPDGRVWFTGVRSDLEEMGYAVGGADLCAASVSAPHRRQRIWFVANAGGAGPFSASQNGIHKFQNSPRPRNVEFKRRGAGSSHGLGDTDRYQRQWWSGPVQMGWNGITGTIIRGGRPYAAQWRVGPGISIVAHGLPNRVESLCGAGNAIVPQVAAEFILASGL